MSGQDEISSSEGGIVAVEVLHRPGGFFFPDIIFKDLRYAGMKL